MNKVISFLMAALAFVSAWFSGGKQPGFQNEYTVPETLAPYTQLDTAPKTDWTAKVGHHALPVGTEALSCRDHGPATISGNGGLGSRMKLRPAG